MSPVTHKFAAGEIKRARESLRNPLSVKGLAEGCDVNEQAIRRAERGIPIDKQAAAKIAKYLHELGGRVEGPFKLDDGDLIDSFFSTFPNQRGKISSSLQFDFARGEQNKLIVTETTSFRKAASSSRDINFRFGGTTEEILSMKSLEFQVEEKGIREEVGKPNGDLYSQVTRVTNKGTEEEKIGLSVSLPLKWLNKSCIMTTRAKYEVPSDQIFTWNTAYHAKGFQLEIIPPSKPKLKIQVQYFLMEAPKIDEEAVSGEGRMKRIYSSRRYVPAGCGLIWRFNEAN